MHETICWYLNRRKCLISRLLALRDHATLSWLSNIEFIFVFFDRNHAAIITHHENTTSIHQILRASRLEFVIIGRIPIKSIENGNAWYRLHRLSGRVFVENTPNNKTKSMNIFLVVLMIDHPIDISKDCHQTSQIFAQATVVMNLTGQNVHHIRGSRSPRGKCREWSIGCFYIMLDSNLFIKRQNKELQKFLVV